jgi:hypothetical protein
VLDRSNLVAATKAQQAVLDALREGGWELIVAPFPGSMIFGHPSNEIEVPTPAYAREEYAPGRASYPFPTYQHLRQITLIYTETAPKRDGVPATIRLRSVLAREAIPWVGANDVHWNLKRSVEWINEPHPSTPATAGERTEES